MAIYLIIFLSILGILETSYLIKKRVTAQVPVCPIKGDCSLVLESKWNKVFLIPNDVLGLMFFITTILISVFIIKGWSFGYLYWNALLLGIASLGSIFSLFFIYLQLKVIKSFCSWCIFNSILILAMEVVLLFNK